MPIFLERFVLVLCAVIVGAVLVSNPMKFDTTQRVTLGLAAVFLAYFAAHTIYNYKKPTADLKERAAKLSHEILEYLAERKLNEPELRPGPSGWDQVEMDRWSRYGKDTMNQFSVKFAARAQAICADLKDAGFADDRFQSACEHPTNPLGIQECGQRMGEYAERLP
jgi:hypothetical protein